MKWNCFRFNPRYNSVEKVVFKKGANEAEFRGEGISVYISAPYIPKAVDPPEAGNILVGPFSVLLAKGHSIDYGLGEELRLHRNQSQVLGQTTFSSFDILKNVRFH